MTIVADFSSPFRLLRWLPYPLVRAHARVPHQQHQGGDRGQGEGALWRPGQAQEEGGERTQFKRGYSIFFLVIVMVIENIIGLGIHFSN